MRFIHIADVHLGAKPDREYPWGKEREKEIWDSLIGVLGVCEKEQTDLLLIAGDLFHRKPLLRELKELNYQFGKLSHTQVVLIAGNHDFIGAGSQYAEFVWESNVHMLKEEQMEKVVFDELKTEVYGFSYHTRNIPEARYDSIRPDSNEYLHILIAHGGDERNVPIDRSALKELPFDYVALGHIHKAEQISGKAWYSGSLEPLDKTELGEHGYIRGEINESGISAEFVPFSTRTYEWLKFTVNHQMSEGAVFDALKAQITSGDDKIIYRVLLNGYKDPEITFRSEYLMQLPNVVEVTDETVPDYDFGKLHEENQENIIGLYIQRIHESSTEDEIKRKALYYGLEALLSAKAK